MSDPIASPMNSAPLGNLAAYLNTLRLRADLSVREFAQAAGYKNGSSVQRYLDDPSIDALQIKVAARLSAALYGRGSPPIGLHDLAPLVNATLTGDNAMTESALARLLSLKVANQDHRLSSVEEAPARRMPIVGSAHASFWMPQAPSLDTPEDWLTIPFAASNPLPGQYVLRIVGPSINRVAADGTFAILQQFVDGFERVPEGKFVHVERERGGEIEWTLKLARWGADGLHLWPRSDHKDYQSPLPFGAADGVVRIKGIVIGWYTPA